MTATRSRVRIGRTARGGDGEQPPPKEVHDDTGVVWEVRGPIGKGGQGAVYHVQDPRFAVKLLHTKDGDAERADRTLRERLSALRVLPLEDLPVARPRVTLRQPHAGYVMDLLTDMVPLRQVAEPPQDADADDLVTWFRRTGGLRRRLRVLARCAEILAELHGRGIVYCDVSPVNIMISASAQRDEVWLIDADNLSFEADALARSIGTDFFEAPEVLRDRGGNNTFTDAFSFAVLAYHTLVGEHPLIGDLADTTMELEWDARLGLLPWTGHSSDSRNRSSFGMDRAAVLHPKLLQLCELTFEAGMHDPLRRPNLADWARVLRAAVDRLVDCPGCGSAFYASAPHCPFCDTRRPPVVLISVLTYVPASQLPPSGEDTLVVTKERIVVQADRTCRVTARTTDRLADDPHAPVVDVRWDGATELTIRNRCGEDLRLTAPSGELMRVLRAELAVTIQVDAPGASWLLHFGDDDRIHRVLAFDSVG